MQLSLMAGISEGARIAVVTAGLCLFSTIDAAWADNDERAGGDPRIPEAVSSSHLVQHRKYQECMQREQFRQRDTNTILDVSQGCRNELTVLKDNLPPGAVESLALVERDNLRRDQERSLEHEFLALERSARAEKSRTQQASRDAHTVSNFKSLSRCQRAARLQSGSANDRATDPVDCVARLGLTDIEVADIQSYLRKLAEQQ